jgi:hypothetical protein
MDYFDYIFMILLGAVGVGPYQMVNSLLSHLNKRQKDYIDTPLTYGGFNHEVQL